MNSDLYFDGKRYISSSRAAKITGYVNDYIGQLCRDNKIECRMVGRSWYVALDSLVQYKNLNGTGTRSRGPQKISEDHVSPILGSLRESEKKLFVPGKISAVKTSGSTDFSQPVTVVSAPKIKNQIFISYPFGVEVSKVEIPVFVPAKKRRSMTSLLAPVAKLSLVSFAIIFALIGFRFGMYVSPSSNEIYAGAFQEVSKDMQASALSGFEQTFNQVAVAWHDTVQSWLFDTRQMFFALTGNGFAQNTIQPASTDQANSAPNQGMVVVPINPNMNQDAVVAKVKQSFSDQVSVSPNSDGQSGVITPVFKKTKGDEYLYVMVPIKN
jgi:hypothetical protein